MFRHSLVDSLVNSGFDVQAQDVKVYYEGRYMSIRASFDGAQGIVYLKPHIAIDCFLGELELKPETKNISSMIKVTLGDSECDHRYFSVPCVALNETAAEKWVALSRRIVDANQTPRDSDKHLVRHLYDLYQLKQQNCLSDDYYIVLERVLEKSRKCSGLDLLMICAPKWNQRCIIFVPIRNGKSIGNFSLSRWFIKLKNLDLSRLL